MTIDELREMARRVLRDELDPSDVNTAYKLAEAILKTHPVVDVTKFNTPKGDEYHRGR